MAGARAPLRGLARQRLKVLRRLRAWPAIAAAQEILEQRFADPLRLDELAREVELSPFELSRQFRRQTGWTVHRYLTHLRLAHGLDRLAKAPSTRLLDLGLELGFDGHSHFTDVFRRWVGSTPLAFRAADSTGERRCHA